MKKFLSFSSCILSLFLASFFTSCASTNVPEGQKEDLEFIDGDDTASSEYAEDKISEEIPIDPVVYDEENPEALENTPDTEPVLEPVQDMEGFFESEPVILDMQPENEIPDVEVPLLSDEEILQENEQTQSAQENTFEKENNSEQNALPAVSTPLPPKEENTLTEDGVEISSAFTQEISAEENVENNVPAKTKEIIPSRTVTIKNNQFLDISYPGSGWVYLGETDDGTKLRYFGRKLGSTDTLFTLRGREEGKAILHFYKNDALTGQYIDDYLEVIIKGVNTSQERITAPEYKEIVPPKPEKAVDKVQETLKSELSEKNAQQKNESSSKSEDSKNTNTKKVQKASPAKEPQKEETSAPEDNAQTVISNTKSQGSVKTSDPIIKKDSGKKAQADKNLNQSATENEDENLNLSADELLQKARNHINAKEYEQALSALDTFFDRALTKLDEGYYLKGQALESNSKVRNIKEALSCYETVVNLYPQSPLWQKAQERVTYLKKFYFNIW